MNGAIGTTATAPSDTTVTSTRQDTAVTAKPIDTTPVVTSPVVVPAASAEPTALIPQPREQSTVPVPQEPVGVVATAMLNLMTAIATPGGDTPTAPADSPATWTLLAAARKETFGSVPELNTLVMPVTNSLQIGAVSPTPVVAIPQTPPLAWLQQLPVLGPLFVTPIFVIIHQIPIVSDVLHPFIGFPVQIGLAAGSPMPRDVKVISFDGTEIYTHFIPALGLTPGHTAPTILNGPGLGLPGATNLDGALFDDVVTDAVGQVSIAKLRAAGYNVVTWDPRGEWNSGGVLELDSPDFEGRDVSAIISWLATQPEVQLDDAATLDPRIGMVGVSYGGGIQLVTAAIDHRVDAIVPTIAWNTLNTALYKNDAFKSSWGSLLTAALIGTGARVNPQIYPAAVYGTLTGMLTPSVQQLLADRGPGARVNDIVAPTLLIQGTVDTLFSLQEADTTARVLIANGVPTKVLWFCGGHGVCANNPLDLSDGAVIERQTLNWLDRYVKGEGVDTGPQFEWVDQRGQWFSSALYPVVPAGPVVTASSAGAVLPIIPVIGGSGLPVVPFGIVAANAVNLVVPAAATTTYVVGAPQLTLTYSGTGSASHVYAQLIDNSTGLVLGSQVTPIPVTLDGQTHTIALPLEPVAHTLRPGETVTLQLVASAGTYTTIVPSLGQLNVSSLQITLPTVANPMAEPSPLTTV